MKNAISLSDGKVDECECSAGNRWDKISMECVEMNLKIVLGSILGSGIIRNFIVIIVAAILTNLIYSIVNSKS